MRPCLLGLLAGVTLALGGCGMIRSIGWGDDVDVTWGLGGHRLAAAPVLPAPQNLMPQPVQTVAVPPAPLAADPRTVAIELAWKARQAGDDMTAGSLFRKVLTDQPDDKEAKLGLAATLLDSGNVEGAKPLGADLLKKDPNDPRVLALMARIDMAGGDLDMAAGRLALAMAGLPGNRDILLAHGVFQDLRGNHAAARNDYNQVLASAPDDVSARNDLALSLIAEGEAAKAIPLLEGANMTVSKPVIRRNLALAYGLEGRETEARSLLTQDMPAGDVESTIRYYRLLRSQRPRQ